MNEEAWDEMEPNPYTLSFDNGVFVPCPFCGAEVAAPDCGFQSEADAMTWAIENCTCPASRKFEREEKRVLVGTFCETGKFQAETGGCQHFEGKACTKEKCSAYHPELEASALYSAGLYKWQAAQDAEKAWQDFEPVATMLAWAVRLPEPAPYWEPPKPQRIEVGTCH